MPNKSKYRRGLRDPRRSGIKWSITAGLSLLVVSALVLSNARATSSTAQDGVALARAEAALGANDLAVKALGQAVLLAEDNALGVADDETLTLALGEAAATLNELTSRIEELDDALDAESPLLSLGDGAVGSGNSVVEMIESGLVDSAGVALAGDAVRNFEMLRDELSVVRETQEELLNSTGATATRIAEIVTFLVALLLPLGAVMAYRYAARRQLRNAEAQLDTRLEAEREVVRAKDEFIGNISHELRTPLTSIFGFSELLLEKGAVDPSSAMDLIGLINHESAELTRMVEDLLVSARVEANALVYKNQSVDIADELNSVMAIMKHTGATVDVLIADTECWGDPVRVRQILRNLLSNAQRYGGDKVRFTARREGAMLEMVVADNGPGVPPEMEPRLFTRFVHGGNEALMTGSVGLGLSVVGSLVDAMGGIVAYENRNGWARFIVGLPVDAPPPPEYADELDAKSAAQIEFLKALRSQAPSQAEVAVSDGG
jgi:signal transduction histidine kinase